jgi:hypothetical protein
LGNILKRHKRHTDKFKRINEKNRQRIMGKNEVKVRRGIYT